MEQILPDATDLGIWPLELSQNKFLLFEGTHFVDICYSSPGKWKQQVLLHHSIWL